MYCIKCGGDVVEGAKFCPQCGAPAPEQAGPAAVGTSAGFSGRQDHTPDTTWHRSQMQPAPAKQGLPAWAWILIGCASLIVIGVIVLAVFSFAVAKKITDQVGGGIAIFSAGELSTVQEAMQIYYEENGVYADFTALRDAGYLSELDPVNITGTSLDTEFTGFKLELESDGSAFRLTATAKQGDKSWDVDETSPNVMSDAVFSIFGEPSGETVE